MEYWDLYKDKTKEAAEAQAKALDHIREVTHEALVENENYQKSLLKASEPHDKYASALEREETVFNAQIKSKRELMKLDEQDELAKAKTPAEREAIKQKYAGLDANVEAAAEGGKIKLLQQTVSEIKAEFDKNEVERTALEQLKKNGADRPELLEQIGPRLKELDERNIELAQKLTHYREQIGTESSVKSINDDERLRASNRTISRYVEGSDAGVAQGHAMPDMKELAQGMGDLFGKYRGGWNEVVAIVRYHLQHSTSQDQEISALKNALAGLQRQNNSFTTTVR